MTDLVVKDYNREDLLIDVIGYIHLTGDTADYKQLMEYGYSKADIVDFCLGMGIPHFNDSYELAAEAISPRNMDCICGRNFALVDEIYRFHEGETPEKQLDREDYIILCGKCVEKTLMMKGLEPSEVVKNA